MKRYYEIIPGSSCIIKQISLMKLQKSPLNFLLRQQVLGIHQMKFYSFQITWLSHCK